MTHEFIIHFFLFLHLYNFILFFYQFGKFIIFFAFFYGNESASGFLGLGDLGTRFLGFGNWWNLFLGINMSYIDIWYCKHKTINLYFNLQKINKLFKSK
jgi:hypothetical protein